MKIVLTSIEPSYRKESGQYNLNFDDVPLPEGFVAADNAIVSLPPKQVGGNHKHPRTEIFIGMGEELAIYWLDENRKRHSEQLNPKGQLRRCIVPPFVPHAIANHGMTTAYILEFADAKQTREDVDSVIVVTTEDL